MFCSETTHLAYLSAPTIFSRIQRAVFFISLHEARLWKRLVFIFANSFKFLSLTLHILFSFPPRPLHRSTQVTKPTTPVTFYMRELPPLCIPFSSKEGKDLFKSAMAAGTMEGFFKLMEQFRTQEEPSYCGLASLAMVRYFMLYIYIYTC